MSEIVIRPATAADAAEIVRLIAANARFHGKAELAKITPESIRRHGFGAAPSFWTYLALRDGAAVGIAQYFFIYHGWSGTRALYVNDLYVDEAVRGAGVGRRLMAAVARRARVEGCSGIGLGVRHDNPARRFYERLGMSEHADAINCRLEGEALSRLAAEAG